MWHLESLDRFVSWFKDVWYLHIYIFIFIHIYIHIYVFFNMCVEQKELEGKTGFFIRKKFHHHGWAWYAYMYIFIFIFIECFAQEIGKTVYIHMIIDLHEYSIYIYMYVNERYIICVFRNFDTDASH